MSLLLQVLCVVCALVGCSRAAGYGGAVGYASAGATLRPAAVAYAPAVGSAAYTGAYNPGIVYPPQPYNFDYEARDEQGNVHYRQEQGDTGGVVRGSYGYTDNQGLYRVVEYVADANGFRANVRTNEPGVGKASPADVALAAADPPAGIYDRYTRPVYRTAGSYPVGAAVPHAAGVPHAAHAVGVPHAAHGVGFHGAKAGY